MLETPSEFIRELVKRDYPEEDIVEGLEECYGYSEKMARHRLKDFERRNMRLTA